MNNNQEAEFRDWVSKADYQSLVKAFNNSCGLKREIVSDEISCRFDKDLEDQLTKVQSLLTTSSVDWAETHTYLQNLCRKLGYDEKDIEGDNYFVPDIIDLADMIYNRTAEGIKEKLDQQKVMNDSAETRQLKLFDIPEISPESLERRINRKLP